MSISLGQIQDERNSLSNRFELVGAGLMMR
jgi:hypothetical protein